MKTCYNYIIIGRTCMCVSHAIHFIPRISIARLNPQMSYCMFLLFDPQG